MKFKVYANGKIFDKPSKFKKYVLKNNLSNEYFIGSYKNYKSRIYLLENKVYVERFDLKF